MSQLAVERDGNVLVVALSGEIDMANAPELERAISDSIVAVPAVAIDLSAVTFFDSSGVRLLDRVTRLCARDAVPVRVIAPDGCTARYVLRLTAFPEDLIAGSREAADPALRSPQVG
jgi:anti-sigma B factor antagonist